MKGSGSEQGVTWKEILSALISSCCSGTRKGIFLRFKVLLSVLLWNTPFNWCPRPRPDETIRSPLTLQQLCLELYSYVALILCEFFLSSIIEAQEIMTEGKPVKLRMNSAETYGVMQKCNTATDKNTEHWRCFNDIHIKAWDHVSSHFLSTFSLLLSASPLGPISELWVEASLSPYRTQHPSHQSICSRRSPSVSQTFLLSSILAATPSLHFSISLKRSIYRSATLNCLFHCSLHRVDS